MGKINKNVVTMVNIYCVIRHLGGKSGATGNSILNYFLENTVIDSHELWLKIKKRLHLGLIAKIFKYSNGRYRIADDVDTDAGVVDIPADASRASSRSSSRESRPDDSETSSVRAKSNEVPPPPRWLGEYLKLDGHGQCYTWSERARQRCKILGALKEHYAAKRRNLKARLRRLIVQRPRATPSYRRRCTTLHATYRRLPTSARRRRRREACVARRRTRRASPRLPCVTLERSHEEVINRLWEDMVRESQKQKTCAEERPDIFKSELKIDFSSKPNDSRTIQRSPDAEATSSSNAVSTREENRSSENTLVNTPKTNPSTKPTTPPKSSTPAKLSPKSSTTMNNNARTSGQSSSASSTSSQRGGAKPTPQKTPCPPPRGMDIISALGMEDLVTVIDNPMKIRRKLNMYRMDGSPKLPTALRCPFRDLPWRGPRIDDDESDDEDFLPKKRSRRT